MQYPVTGKTSSSLYIHETVAHRAALRAVTTLGRVTPQPRSAEPFGSELKVELLTAEAPLEKVGS
jgi:hypothetical protein